MDEIHGLLIILYECLSHIVNVSDILISINIQIVFQILFLFTGFALMSRGIPDKEVMTYINLCRNKARETLRNREKRNEASNAPQPF